MRYKNSCSDSGLVLMDGTMQISLKNNDRLISNYFSIYTSYYLCGSRMVGGWSPSSHKNMLDDGKYAHDVVGIDEDFAMDAIWCKFCENAQSGDQSAGN